MIKRFLSARKGLADPVLPEGQRIYAIGDVHGCRALLEALIVKIDADDRARGDATMGIVLLGDLVDRGDDSAGVIDTVRALGALRTVRSLRGNHEDMFLGALDGDGDSIRAFCRFGGRETILSYGVSIEDYERMGYGEVAQSLAEVVPASHRAFIEGMEDMIVVGDYAFVHAGIRPGVPLDQQRARDLRWIREPFLSHRGPHEKTIVHGHTITSEVEITPVRIGVDTGAYESGRLSAIGLEGAERWVIDVHVDELATHRVAA